MPERPPMPLLWPRGLQPGDPLGGPLFPQVLPELIETEGRQRARGPEPPDATVQNIAREARRGA